MRHAKSRRCIPAAFCMPHTARTPRILVRSSPQRPATEKKVGPPAGWGGKARPEARERSELLPSEHPLHWGGMGQRGCGIQIPGKQRPALGG